MSTQNERSAKAQIIWNSTNSNSVTPTMVGSLFYDINIEKLERDNSNAVYQTYDASYTKVAAINPTSKKMTLIDITDYVEGNLESKSNKSDSYTASSSTTYASTKALVDGLATKLDKGTYTGTASDLYLNDQNLLQSLQNEQSARYSADQGLENSKQNKLETVSGNTGVGKTDASATEKLDIAGRTRSDGIVINETTSAILPKEIKFKDGKFKAALADGVEKSVLLEGDVSGKSAYEIAVSNGFVGTEAEWLDSLKPAVLQTTGTSTTDAMSQKAATESFSKVVVGKNLVDTTKGTFGKFLYDTVSMNEGTSSSWNITDYIPATENLVANQTLSAGIANVVYNSSKVAIRRFNDNTYEYQSGDAFVRFSYNNTLPFQVEKGTVSTSFEPYTDKGDVFTIADLRYTPTSFTPIELNVDKINIVHSLANGGVKRKFGMDIPSASVGTSSYLQVKPFSTAIQGSYKVDVILNFVNHNSFMTGWSQVNTSLGKGCIKISKTFTNVNEILNVVLFPNNLVAGTDRFFRISQVFITPLNSTSQKELNKRVDYVINRKQIDVSKYFDSTTDGWGITRFNDIITAWETDSADYLNGRKDRKTIFKVMPGLYSEFETKWAGSDAEDVNNSAYQGIKPHDNQEWESFDVDIPSLTELRWNGEAGYSAGYTMSTAQAMKKAIFHISDWKVKTRIEGFKITSRNTRYCVHPESAGTGYGNEWILRNLLLDWGGRTRTSTDGGCHIGIGISTGEIGLIENVKCIGVGTIKGINGHNNGYSAVNLPPAPVIINGARLTLKNVDLGSGNIEFQTYSNDAETYDVLTLDNVINVNLARFYEDVGKTKNWKANIIAAEITTNQL